MVAPRICRVVFIKSREEVHWLTPVQSWILEVRLTGGQTRKPSDGLRSFWEVQEERIQQQIQVAPALTHGQDEEFEESFPTISSVRAAIVALLSVDGQSRVFLHHGMRDRERVRRFPVRL